MSHWATGIRWQRLFRFFSCVILSSQMSYVILRLIAICGAARKAGRIILAVLAALCVCSTCSAAPFVSGEWASMLVLDVSADAWSTEIDFTAELSFGCYLSAARSVFASGAWKKQEFAFEAALGDVSIESDLRFEPYKDRFKDWITEVEWETAPWTITLTTKLTRTTDWMIIEVDHETDCLETDTTFRFRSPSGTCQSAFYDVSAGFEFTWCGIDTDLDIDIDDDGFEKLALELSELPLAQIPWIAFDLEFTRTKEDTAIKLSPDIVFLESWGSGSCELELDGIVGDSSTLHSLAITEIALTWEIDEWDLEATAILDSSDWISKSYWFEMQADATFDLNHCGEVSLEFTLLWSETSLGRVRGAIGYEPCELLAITFETDHDLENEGLDCISLSLKLEW